MFSDEMYLIDKKILEDTEETALLHRSYFGISSSRNWNASSLYAQQTHADTKWKAKI